jgi:hypothetical protein
MMKNCVASCAADLGQSKLSHKWSCLRVFRLHRQFQGVDEYGVSDFFARSGSSSFSHDETGNFFFLVSELESFWIK